MEIRSLQIFREVMLRRSFTRAAHSLHLSVATVSDHVSRLEIEFGVRLLNRTTRTLAPTSAGQAMFDLSNRILRDVTETRDAISGDSEPHGMVRLRVSDTFSRAVLIPKLAAFAERYPKIRIEFLQDDNLFSRSRGMADITIRDVAPFARSFPRHAIVLPTSSTFLVAASDYISKRGSPKAIEDLESHDCIGFIDPDSGRQWEWPLFRDGEQGGVRPPFRFAFSRPIALKAAVLGGLGITPMMEYYVRDHLASGRLVPVLKEYAFSHPMGVLLEAGGNPNASHIKAVIDFIQSCCADIQAGAGLPRAPGVSE